MKRSAPGLQSVLSRFFSDAPDIFLDIGSTTTRVALQGKLVFEEPTCIVVHAVTNAVVAIGAKALSMVGKAPPSLEVIFPVQYGAVAHPAAFTLFLHGLLAQLSPALSFRQVALGRGGAIALPENLSPVERTHYQSALQELHLSSLKPISQMRAATATLIAKPSLSQSYVILNIGGQLTQIAIVSGGDQLASKTVRWGGVQFTDAVQTLVRSEHECMVGWHEAEKLKRDIGLIELPTELKASKTPQLRKSSVRGKDVVTQLSKGVVVSSALFQTRFEQLTQELLEILESFFFGVPSEVVTSALEQGLFLTGGGAQLEGLALTLAHHLHCQVHLSAHPTQDVILGLG